MNMGPLPEATLRDLYLNRELSMKDISEVLNASVGKIHKYIHIYGIEPRTKMTEKAKSIISAKNKGKPSFWKGKKRSDETKAKLRASHLGRYSSPTEYGGHRKKRSDGYMQVYLPSHPKARADGYVMEHTLVIERIVGRYLKDDEVVHHINHIRDDNRVCNLVLMNKREHMSMHAKENIANRRRKKEAMTYQ